MYHQDLLRLSSALVSFSVGIPTLLLRSEAKYRTYLYWTSVAESQNSIFVGCANKSLIFIFG